MKDNARKGGGRGFELFPGFQAVTGIFVYFLMVQKKQAMTSPHFLL